MPKKEKYTVIKYTSENGYTGVLYGKSSFVIHDCDGKMVLHTGFRNIHTYAELVKQVEGYPKFREMLFKMKDEVVIEADKEVEDE